MWLRNWGRGSNSVQQRRGQSTSVVRVVHHMGLITAPCDAWNAHFLGGILFLMHVLFFFLPLPFPGNLWNHPQEGEGEAVHGGYEWTVVEPPAGRAPALRLAQRPAGDAGRPLPSQPHRHAAGLRGGDAHLLWRRADEAPRLPLCLHPGAVPRLLDRGGSQHHSLLPVSLVRHRETRFIYLKNFFSPCITLLSPHGGNKLWVLTAFTPFHLNGFMFQRNQLRGVSRSTHMMLSLHPVDPRLHDELLTQAEKTEENDSNVSKQGGCQHFTQFLFELS